MLVVGIDLLLFYAFAASVLLLKGSISCRCVTYRVVSSFILSPMICSLLKGVE